MIDVIVDIAPVGPMFSPQHELAHKHRASFSGQFGSKWMALG